MACGIVTGVSGDGDARSLASSAQAALRERAVRMLDRGFTHAAVAEAMGINVRAVAKWSARFQISGWEGLRERRRGRRPGEQMARCSSATVMSAVCRSPPMLRMAGARTSLSIVTVGTP